MSTTAFLFEAIKAHLRSRSLTYVDLAGGLGVSEGTVKRIFSRKRCSTEQLDAICAFLQLELPDLVRTLPPAREGLVFHPDGAHDPERTRGTARFQPGREMSGVRSSRCPPANSPLAATVGLRGVP